MFISYPATLLKYLIFGVMLSNLFSGIFQVCYHIICVIDVVACLSASTLQDVLLLQLPVILAVPVESCSRYFFQPKRERSLIQNHIFSLMINCIQKLLHVGVWNPRPPCLKTGHARSSIPVPGLTGEVELLMLLQSSTLPSIQSYFFYSLTSVDPKDTSSKIS